MDLSPLSGNGRGYSAGNAKLHAVRKSSVAFAISMRVGVVGNDGSCRKALVNVCRPIVAKSGRVSI